MAEPIEIDVWQGDISELEVDALVLGATESLFMTTGPAAAVKRRGGPQIERDAVEQGPIPAGEAIVTAGATLAAPYVVHAVAVGHDRTADAERLASAIRRALAFAEPLQLRRIAIGLLGAEHGVFPADEAASILVSTLRAGARHGPITSVVIATANPTETHAVAAALARPSPATR
jgi:O-acetyl-ADP-ribose deacetylase (regulator of RNase III)